MKIVSIVGARPQFIKAAMLSRILRSRPACAEVLVHTGQHYDENMSGAFFHDLDLPEPKHHLNIGSGPHGQQTGRMLEAVEQVLAAEAPHVLVVFGDTNSTLAGALAAAKLQIPVAHVEAGLRSFNRRMPEEINRVVVDHLSVLLFAPTTTAARNLQQEGIPDRYVHVVGDIMYDACLFYAARAEQHRHLLDALGLSPGQFILATVHRAENTDTPERLRTIIQSLAELAREMPVVIPLHPRTEAMLRRIGREPAESANLRVIKPVGYLDMMLLAKHARLILTDSGGLQKEAFFHRVPCVTLRDETEWVELVAAQWNRLAPPVSVARILDAARSALVAPCPPAPPDLYGNGQAANRIGDIIEAQQAPQRGRPAPENSAP